MIASAIGRGAPAFNAGDHHGCYVMYQGVANTLLQTPNALPDSAARRLHAALQEASTKCSPTDRAWAMRHGLDDVITTLRGGGGQDLKRPQEGESSWEVFNFSDRSLAWAAVDDRVMGGSSRSGMVMSANGATFEGDLVLANGGFASIRCVIPPEVSARLRGATSLLLMCAGDGRSGYKITVKTDRQMDGVMYQLAFTPQSGAMQTIRLPLSAFRANFRGRPVQGAPPLQGEDIVQIGLMLSRFTDEGGSVNSVPAGGFRLQLGSLAASRRG